MTLLVKSVVKPGFACTCVPGHFRRNPSQTAKCAVISDRIPGQNPTATKSWSSGSCGDGANCARTATKCKCTASPDSPNWHHPALASLHGRDSWQRCDASPSWSANHAMTTSTPGSHRPLSQPRHRSLESRMPGNRARPVRRGTAPKRTANAGTSRRGLPNLWYRVGQRWPCSPTLFGAARSGALHSLPLLFRLVRIPWGGRLGRGNDDREREGIRRDEVAGLDFGPVR